MALKSDAYGFLVGAPVEWGRALQIFNEIRDEVRALRGDIAGGASIKALERAADAVSRQAKAVTRTSVSTTSPRSSTPKAAPVRAPKPVPAVPTRAAPGRAAPVRGPNGRFISATPTPSLRQPYQISVIGVDAVATPAGRPQAADSGILSAAEFEARRAKSARPSSRDEIRRQNAAMSQARPAPMDADAKTSKTTVTPEARAADRAARQAAVQEAREENRKEQRSARADEREEAKRIRDANRQRQTEEREAAKRAGEPGIASKAYGAVGNAPEIDPTITALHEVQSIVTPVGRGFSKIFGAAKRGPLNRLFGKGKESSTFHKAEMKVLTQIRDNTNARGKGAGGILGAIPGLSLLSKIPGMGLIGRVLGGGARGLGGLAGLALRGSRGLLRRLPLVGGLIAGGSAIASMAGFNDDPNASPAENRERRFTGAGSGIGAIAGGALGSLLGPVGTVVGGMIGDKVGELVGKWLSTLDWAKIGATISDTWDSAVKDFSAIWDSVSKWFEDKFGLVTKLAGKANDYIKDKTGVDVKATAVKAAKAYVGVVKETAKVAGNVATAATGYVAERATRIAAPIGNAISSLIEASGIKRIFRKADGSIEQREGGSVSWRNNNAGNLKFEYAGSADKTVKSKRTKAQALAAAQKRYDGVVDLDQWGNAIFATEASGDAARAKLIKGSHGNETVDQMLKGYAKDDYTGKANIGAYAATINKVAAARGLDLRGKKISDLSSEEFAALMDGMKKMEGFKVGKTTATPGSLLASNGASATAMSPSLPAPSIVAGVNVPVVADAPAPVLASLGKPPPVEVRISKDAGDVGPTVSDPKIARLVSGGLS